VPRLTLHLGKRWLASLCAGALLFSPAAAQIRSGALPTLGDGAELTLSAERRLGERIAREIYRDPDYIDDPLVAEYLGQIWQKLLASARGRGDLTAELDQRFAWEIMLGRDRSVNAFALPGGYLGVHMGLVGVVSSRDELASVLAHELSHVTQRHIARLMAKQDQQSLWMIGALILGALAASRRPEAANAIAAGGQALAIQGQLNFSRDMEREADRIGFGVMEQAGYDARGFASMFDKLQQAARLNDFGAYPYLRTHPLTSERIADMAAREPASRRPALAEAPDLEHMMIAARARVLSQPGADGLRALVSDADTTRFDTLAPARRAALLYQAALASLRLQQLPSAAAFASRLIPLVANDPGGARLNAILQVEMALEDLAPSLAAGDGAATVNRLLAGVEHRNGALLRRPELLAASQLLLRGGRAADAAQRLRSWVAEHPRDALAWQLLASANAAQGLALRGIRAEAEARVAHYDYAAALDRFKAAQELMRKNGPAWAGADHLEASIIDARARQVGLLARDQALER
jgi:predicted Zn-dependent protease